MRTYLITFAVSLIIALVLTPWIRDWAIRRNLTDSPGGRKIHKTAIPRLGGMAVLIAFVVPVAALVVLNLTGVLSSLDTDSANKISTALWSDPVGRSTDLLTFWGAPSLIKSLVLGLFVLAVVGIVDDLKGIRARYKLIAQILASTLR